MRCEYIFALRNDAADKDPEKAFFDLQESVDSGLQSWRLDPVEVARDFAMQTLKLEGSTELSRKNEKEFARVNFTMQSGEEIHIDLYQPARKGQGGIWEVECWYDENSRLYQIRDLTALPPIFYNDDNVPENVKKAVRGVVMRDWAETFGLYYNVLGFYADNVEYTSTDGTAEIEFIMTIVTQNFYKDPDTVEYIREAKEKGSINYQRLFDEYNSPRKANVNLKVTMSLDDSGEALPETMEVFSDISVTEDPEYVPVKAVDFIIGD
jgi:hypothetical protein